MRVDSSDAHCGSASEAACHCLDILVTNHPRIVVADNLELEIASGEGVGRRHKIGNSDEDLSSSYSARPSCQIQSKNLVVV